MSSIQPLEPRLHAAGLVAYSLALVESGPIYPGESFEIAVRVRENHRYAVGVQLATAASEVTDRAIVDLVGVELTDATPAFPRTHLDDFGGMSLLSLGGQLVGDDADTVFAVLTAEAVCPGETVISLGEGGRATRISQSGTVRPAGIEYGELSITVSDPRDVDLGAIDFAEFGRINVALTEAELCPQ